MRCRSSGTAERRPQLTSFSPQISFNFGTGNGWSYITGGIGPSTWSLVPDGSTPLAIDDTRLQTVNYGGGARWFAKRHVAFTVDLRFYDIAAGVAEAGFPAHPLTRFLVIGAGICDQVGIGDRGSGIGIDLLEREDHRAE